MMTRAKTLIKWLDVLMLNSERATPWVRALEVGRIRFADEVRGHSTLHIATHAVVKSLLSIDESPATRGVTLEVVPAEFAEKIEFIDADSVQWMAETVARDGRKFDFIYLDGLNDAEHVLAELQLCIGLSHKGTIIIIDDVDERYARKGDLAVPYAKKHENLFTVEEEVMADETCQGMLVLSVKPL